MIIPRPNVQVSLIFYDQAVLKDFTITYGFVSDEHGTIVLGFTEQFLCTLGLFPSPVDEEKALRFIQETWGNTPLHRNDKASAQYVQALFSPARNATRLAVLVKGSHFDYLVWQAVCSVPFGTTATYQTIAQRVNRPAAFRAVGRSIGKNPVSLFIPCHRIVRTSGGLGGYRWGLSLKQRLLELEAAV